MSSSYMIENFIDLLKISQLDFTNLLTDKNEKILLELNEYHNQSLNKIETVKKKNKKEKYFHIDIPYNNSSLYEIIFKLKHSNLYQFTFFNWNNTHRNISLQSKIGEIKSYIYFLALYNIRFFN